MNRKRRSSRRGLNISVAIIVLLFLFTGSIAYPSYWNKLADATPLPALDEDGFRLGLDLQGGVHLVYEADMSDIDSEDRSEALEGVRDVIERRVNAFGVSEPHVQTTVNGDSYRVIIELAGVFDVSDAIDLIGETPILEFKLPNEDLDEDLTLTDEETAQMEEAQELEREEALTVLDRAISGEEFTSLVTEFSDNRTTSAQEGYIGFVTEEQDTFGELARQIKENGYSTGVIDGLYEAESSLHVVNYISTVEQEEAFLSHILICHNESESCEGEVTKAEALVEAQEIASTVTTATFPQTAVDSSDGPSAPVAGELGWVTEGTMVNDFQDAYLAMEDGQISDVVETQFGYHVIWRQDSRSTSLYEISHIQLGWTTESDILDVDAWMNTDLSGKDVERASVAFDQNTNVPYVLLDFSSEGGDMFGQITEENVGEVIGIFLDGAAISTPVVQEPIYGGTATIQGSFSLEEAKVLAQRLNAGALPVPIDLLSQQTVGPTLGQESLQASIRAALIGVIFLAIFMIAYYRLSGLLAVLALIFYISINLALYKWLGVTMTLAGIAGFILSMGMAVDANVLIFERLKEELKSGRDLPTAIDEGFRRAWTSIRDGNLTTLIAAAVLFSMSTSFIKGFALTLALGILVSMGTAIMVTRVLLKWASSWKALKNPGLYGVNKK
ncbi:protein translocase subunit SecD [Candidatus Uhrbacteria bacterium]|jgi:protein-export membrane protein SecD|nr:protein translocase subunit SecD [Candidatus Uhrbacteria bacterium]